MSSLTSNEIFITREELASDQKVDSFLSDYKPIASYNWHVASQPNRPLMIIPGEPKYLKNYSNVKQLQNQRHKHIIDENRYYHPEYPIEPLFRAVQICSPDFDLKSIDFVTDRNNLRKFLNFIEGKSKDFQVDFQRVGDLIIFIRNDKKRVEISNDFGLNFEKKLTNSTLNQAKGYRRVVSYKLGDFRFLTRFEVDCVEKESQNDQIESLNKSLVGMSLNLSSKFSFNSSNLSFIKYGDFKQDDKLVELTTKSCFNGKNKFPKIKWNQLFFSQTECLIIGWHSMGSIKKIEKLNFQEVSQRCARGNIQTSLSKLNDLLSRIKSFAISEKKAYSAIYKASSNFILLKESQDHIDCLPKEFYEVISKKSKN